MLPTRPVSVEYSLTSLGETLIPVVEAIVRWAEEHAGDVLRARGEPLPSSAAVPSDAD